jgi:perosamine synthetase
MSGGEIKYPFCLPVLADGTAEAIQAVIERNFLNEGREAAKLEAAVAEVCGVDHAIAVTSGTVGITLALMACGVGAGDEVIIPDITYVASANAVALTGAKPVLVDVESESLGMSAAAAAAAITSRTKAILPVHVSGRAPFELATLLELARNNGLRVVEDAAEGLGSIKGGVAAGAYGDAGAFSFSPNKTISSGQGGMVVTNDPAIALRIRQLKNQGRAERGTGGADEHPTPGGNFKYTDLQAVVALQQMPELPERLEKLRGFYRIYRDELANLPGIRILPFDVDGGECPQWTDAIIEDRDSLHDFLVERQAQPRKMWFPVHRHPPYAQADGAFPQATELAYKGLWLPSALTMSNDDVRVVCSLIKDWVGTRDVR